MRIIIYLCAFCITNTVWAGARSVEQTLDALHASASTANAEVYFDLYTDNAKFIGTDAGENWSIDEFKQYAMPYFSKGKGWTYTLVSREVFYSNDHKVAWFMEILSNASYGTTRGTGVLENVNGEWKIAQYHLTIPIPNAMAKSVAAQIESMAATGNEH